MNSEPDDAIMAEDDTGLDGHSQPVEDCPRLEHFSRAFQSPSVLRRAVRRTVAAFGLCDETVKSSAALRPILLAPPT